MRTLAVLAFFLSVVLAVQGIECWTCNNEKSNADCIKNGKMEKCQASQQVCETEVRRGSYGLMVTKRCKQKHACMNNQMQNPLAAWEPSQCNEKVPSSVCRCCCADAKVCKNTLNCKNSTEDFVCERIKMNTNVKMQCEYNDQTPSSDESFLLGTICEFSCGKGYQLVGFKRSVCTQLNSGQSEAAFDNPSPQCNETSCSILPPLRNGRTRCSDRNYAGSVCSFTCNSGYVLEGNQNTRCDGTRRSWTRLLPECKVGWCNPEQSAPPNGRVTCTNENFIRSVCSINCNLGYTLIGNPSTTCNANTNSATAGRWSRQLGVCTADCPNAVAPDNGQVTCTDTNKPGSVCTYTCNNGFFMDLGSSPYPDSTTQTCQSRSTGEGAAWNPSTRVVCRPVLCTTLNAPTNGRISCDRGGNNIDSDCIYICNPEYYLSGTDFGPSNDKTTCGITSTSNEDGLGEWTPTPPAVCLPIKCSIIQAPPNGQISCDGENVDDECTYSCNSGYYLSGTGFGPSNDKTTCGTNSTSNVNGIGIWIPTPPAVCSKITCPNQNPPTNGQIFCDGNNIGNECNYSCNSGYFLSGAGFGPSNDKTTCGTTSGSDLSGIGSWSPAPPPVCQPITCPKLEAPENGEILCEGDGENLGNDCTYTCNPKFYISGTGFGVSNDKTTCESHSTSNITGIGEWNPTPPALCRPITCSVLSDPANGQISCDGENVDDECTYICNSGFYLTGTSFGPSNNKTTCGINSTSNENGIGEWTPAPPAVCSPIVCPIQLPPENGNVSCDGYNLGNECTYTCDSGYFLVGPGFDMSNDKSTCETNATSNVNGIGTWEPSPQPTCEADCPDAVAPENGQVSCTDGSNVGSICTYTCNDGYVIDNGADPSPVSRTQTCRSRGSNGNGGASWNPSTSTICKPITCFNLNSPANGHISCNGNTIGIECTYACDPGYYLSGTGFGSTNDIITCGANSTSNLTGIGEWKPTPPAICQPITCPNLEDPANGQISCDGNNVNNQCTYTCNFGFYLSGTNFDSANDQTTCRLNSTSNVSGIGEWDPTPPAICQPIACPNLEDPANGQISCDGENAGDKCTYTCDSGFYISGAGFGHSNDETTCRASSTSSENGIGEWNPTPPALCRPISCSDLEAPANGKVICDGENVGDECIYTCDSGFYLSGNRFGPSNNKTTCGTNSTSNENGIGEWTPSPPAVCPPITCLSLESPANGQISCEGENVGNECTYTCDSGYFLSGTGFGSTNDKTTCGTNSTSNVNGIGEWAPTPPAICQPISCTDVLSDPANGQVVCRGNNIDDECTYICNSGFYLSGTGFGSSNDKITCRTNSTSSVNGIGEWTPSPPAVCPPILCPDPLDSPTNGNISCNGNNIGSECTYICNSGFYLSGTGFGPSNDKTTCGTNSTSNVNGIGEWRPTPPAICQSITCPSLETPANGNMSCEGDTVGDQCTFNCDPGHYLNGPGFGSSNDKTTCQSTSRSNVDGIGEWTPTPPATCPVITCSENLKNPENGQVLCSGNNIDDECTYTCNSGYYLSGTGFGPSNDKTTCGTNSTSNINGIGVWRPTPPAICQSIKCPKLEAPTNGQISCEGDGENIGNDCTYICDPGFYLSGSNFGPSNDKTTCESTSTSNLNGIGIWNPVPPAFCPQIICPDTPNPPTNGEISCDGNNIGSECTYICDSGYFLSGNGLLNDKTFCATNSTSNENGVGEWIPSSPAICRPITCPKLEAPTNGDISCDGENVGDQCNYTCNSGYFLSGTGFGPSNDEITCGVSSMSNENGIGEWTPAPPAICRPITCSSLNDPVNGKILCNGNTIGSECTYTCDSGYYLSGTGFGSTNVITTCQTNSTSNTNGIGEWDPTPPAICQPISCDPLLAPGNGGISCSDGSSLNSICAYACNEGYYLAKDNNRAAGQNELSKQCITGPISNETGKGIWDPSGNRTCQPIVCTRLTSRQSTELICSDDNNFNSICQYNCSFGFRPMRDIGENVACSGPPNRVGRGNWKPRRLLPTCQRIRCRNLLTIQNGLAKCDTYDVGQTCTFECNPGFVRNGVANTTCLLQPTLSDAYFAEWSNKDQPTCSKPCNPVYATQTYDATYNAAIDCTDGSNVESTCTFTCADGFLTEEGEISQVINCQDPGTDVPIWFPASAQPCTLNINA